MIDMPTCRAEQGPEQKIKVIKEIDTNESGEAKVYLALSYQLGIYKTK